MCCAHLVGKDTFLVSLQLQSSEEKKSRCFYLGLVLAIICLFSMGSLRRAWQVNAWSLQFAQQVVEAGSLQVQPAVLPLASHRHASVWMAQVALKQGRTFEVERWLPVLAHRAEKDAWTAYMWARLLWDLQRPTEALQAAMLAGGDRALMEIAYKAQRMALLDVAEQAYRTAQLRNPEKDTLPLVGFLQSMRKYSDAEKVLRQALAGPFDSEVIFLWKVRLGDILQQQEKWLEAESIYRDLIAGYPQRCEGYIGLGWLLYHRDGNLEAALQQFHRSMEVAPECGAAYFAIAEMFFGTGMQENAVACYEQAAAIQPDNQWYVLSWARALRANGNITKSLQILQALLSRWPQFAEGYYEQALTYKSSGDCRLGLQSISTALALKMDKRFLLTQGALYECLGDIANAGNVYHKALRYFPEDDAVQLACQRTACEK